MTVVRQPINRPHHVLMPVEVKCDRCGKSAKIIGSDTSRYDGWGRFEGMIQGGDNTVADLCQSCVLDVRDYINGGKGEGCENIVDRMKREESIMRPREQR